MPRNRFQLEQRLLLELSQAIGSTLNLDQVVQVIADGTARLIGVETAAVYLVEAGRLYLGATTPPLDGSMAAELRWASPADHPTIASALASGQPVLIADAHRAELSPAELVIVELRHLRSLVFLPFFQEGEPVGVLILGTTSATRTFDARDLDLCRTIANQLAVGVQNARLHTRLKQYAAELEQRIAEEARLSEQLRHAQKMEAVGQLAGGVAHDFNNLLQVIRGFSEIARQGLDAKSEAHEAIASVLTATDRASILVRQLLSFARKQVLCVRLVDVNQIIRDLLPMLRPVMGERISLSHCSAVATAPVRADANQLEQVLINLCMNAREAMPEGGAVTLESDVMLADAEQCERQRLPRPGPYVRISVSDTGRGMDEETRRRAFEPFFTTKGPGVGTGLGLAIVHGIVAQHGGATKLHSEPGTGTTVHLYLPASAEEASSASVQTSQPARHGTETILVAEDSPMVQKLAGKVLSRLGYRVLLACDGKEAIHLVDANAATIDLALLDVVMPNGGGQAVFEHLRKRRPDIPVLFATGYGPDMGKLDLTSIAHVGVLQKPYGLEQLADAIRRALDAGKQPPARA